MKIAVLTTFQEFNPGYSLTGIVKDQCRMLLRHGHEVHLFVCEQYNPKYDADLAEGVVLHKTVPFFHLFDYRTIKDITKEHRQDVTRIQNMLAAELQGFDMAFTHDWVFVGWFMPHAMAIQRASMALPGLRWLHWIHSVPCTNSDWWDMGAYGQRHKMVALTNTDRQRVAEQYRGTIADTRVIPHIKDLRSWYDFSEETCAFIDEFPGVMQADVVQVYPASADRLEAKQVDKVVRIFSHMKKRGASVFLACADQWATTKVPRQNEQRVLDLARAVDLTPQEFTFTSRFQEPKFELGISKRFLRELQLCSNLFLFPTIQESWGLVGPEAALSGAFVVLNRSLYNQGEIFNHFPMSFDFSSYHANFEPENWDDYLNAVAGVIVQRLKENESVRTKSFIRQTYNMDAIYSRYYEPIMQESQAWTEGAR